MMNRIKKMLKGEKGFTLVELLAVIVILGIIVAIAIPAIGSIINKAEDDADEAEITMIIDAARLYEVQHEDSLPVDVDTLLEQGYLDERQGGDLPSGSVSRDDDGNLAFNPGS
ncbi:competence type IV pilus major pilin ComGC [Amphibacillus sp. Q70]|uniref:competence type IV pilus major pilin ComGC n=1 Tax=Amphibacillus sp. Q70 TaxID=3453416 RepID=UPI003F856008